MDERTSQNSAPTSADGEPEESDDRGAGSRFLEFIWDTVKAWGPALLTVLLVRSVFAEPFRIPSGSMVPTLQIGDHIVVTKYTYGFRIPLTRIPVGDISAPKRGDVVVFVFPGSDEENGKKKMSYWVDLPVPPLATLDYVKRVVGLPGDTIEVRDNTVIINGVPQLRSLTGEYDFVDDRCRTSPTRSYKEALEGHPHTALATARYGEEMPDYGPVTVPKGHFFAMGDNRDHSSDSRVWGFVPFRNIKGQARFIWLSLDQCAGMLHLRDDRFGLDVE